MRFTSPANLSAEGPKASIVVRPVGPTQRGVASGSALDRPPDPKQGREDSLGLRCPPAWSRGLEGNVEEFGHSLVVIHPVGQYSQGKRLHLGDGVDPRGSVRHHAWHHIDLGQSATVGFLLSSDSERHSRLEKGACCIITTACATA